MTRAQRTLVNAVRYRWPAQARTALAALPAIPEPAGLGTYPEAQRFYRRHADAIWELLAADADAIGFPGPLQAIGHLAGADRCQDRRHVEMLLAWWAVWRVCREESIDNA